MILWHGHQKRFPTDRPWGDPQGQTIRPEINICIDKYALRARIKPATDGVSAPTLHTQHYTKTVVF